MCSVCFDEEFMLFPYSEDFGEFDVELKTKLANGDIIFKSMGVENFPHSLYECSQCKITWWLSLPENNWRGFFVHRDTGRLMLKNITHVNKRQTSNCLFFFAVLIVLMVVVVALNTDTIKYFFLNP